MLNHTYTSVKNANLVDCGKKQHIPSEPMPLLRDKFLGEYRTELDKKKVLANLGIVTDLTLEWEFIKGDIGRSEALMKELDSRTKYISDIDGFQKSLVDGIRYLEGVIGGEEEGEKEQNDRLQALEELTNDISNDLEELSTYLEETIEVDINKLEERLNTVTEKVNNITGLIQVSTKAGNALTLLDEGEVSEGETPGLYVPDLSVEVTTATENIETLRTDVDTIKGNYVTKDDLGGGDFNFVTQTEFDKHSTEITNIKEDLKNTVKTGEDGHVDTLYVNQISKNNDDGNILITDSFEITEGVPLDVRFVVNTLEELKALNPNVCYSGMGVIVNELSSLYILRKPAEGTIIDKDYVNNEFNWKCPDDLVTQALTREEYDKLVVSDQINPHVFYYIYEEEIALTQEPKRESFPEGEEGDAQFTEAWQTWVNSLKILSQEYMSASWGTEIENKLGQKASSDQVEALAQEIANLKGGGEGATLETLSAGVAELKESTEILTERLDGILVTTEEGEVGRIVIAEQNISNIKERLNNYVTKDSLTNDTGEDFIFLKEETYTANQEAFKEELSKEIRTDKLVTNTILLKENSLESTEIGLLYGGNAIAMAADVPILEVMSQTEYDSMKEAGILDDKVYYHTYDTDASLVTNDELNSKLEHIRNSISELTATIANLSERITILETTITS